MSDLLNRYTVNRTGQRKATDCADFTDSENCETKPTQDLGGMSYTSPHLFKRRCERFFQGFRPRRVFPLPARKRSGPRRARPSNFLPNEAIVAEGAEIGSHGWNTDFHG